MHLVALLLDLPWRDAFALAGVVAVAFAALVGFVILRWPDRRLTDNDRAALIGFAVLVLLFFVLGLLGAWRDVAGG